MAVTKAQLVEWGAWWDGNGETPQSVYDARRAHGLGPNGEEDWDQSEHKEDEWPGSSSSSSETSSETMPKSSDGGAPARSTAPSTAGRSSKAPKGSSTAGSAGM